MLLEERELLKLMPRCCFADYLLEDIIAEDKARENDMERKCTLMARSTRKVRKEILARHAAFGASKKLSLELFDALQDLHKLGKRERCWLECAAILHDVGLPQWTESAP